MQRARPWFVGPATHGARATQLFSRSRAHSRERARCAHTGAQQIDAQRSRLMAHSLSRLECRLPLMANTPLGHCTCAPSGSVHPSEGVNGNPNGSLSPSGVAAPSIWPLLWPPRTALRATVARAASNGAAASCCKQRWLVLQATRLPHACILSYTYTLRYCTVLRATMARATSNEAAAPCYEQRWLVLQATRLPI